MSRARQELLAELQVTLTQAVADAILMQQAVADQLGIGLPDFKCLTALTEGGSATAGEIAQRTGLTSGAVTRMIDRLERAGWVRRHHDTVDRRRVIVEPVPERLKEVEPLFAGMAAGWSAALADYDDTQLQLLIELFNRMRALTRDQATAIRTAERSTTVTGAEPRRPTR